MEGPKGSEPPMPPEEACCKRSTMELAAVLSAGEIGAKKWLESRADMAEGITMLGSLAVISLRRLLICGGNSIEERRELQEEPKIGDSLFVEKNCFNLDDPLPPLVLVLLPGAISSEFPG